jgi:hypothetical protein
MMCDLSFPERNVSGSDETAVIGGNGDRFAVLQLQRQLLLPIGYE